MPTPTDRERQSKALGQAFLAHQVSQLEQSVDKLAFSRDSSSSRPLPRPHHRKAPRPIRVLDPSMLVHALPVVKRWVRRDEYRLVVPLAALATLDLLKRAPAPLRDHARDATRFLETQFDIARQIQSDAQIRLRAQAPTEEVSWSDLERRFDSSSSSSSDPDSAEALPTANDIPRALRSTLQCILYFDRLESSAASVAVYNSDLVTPPPVPPATVVVPPPTSSSSATSSSLPPPEIDYLALSSGDAVSYYLATFFPRLSIAVAPVTPEDVVAATEWLRSLARSHQAAAAAAASTTARGDGRTSDGHTPRRGGVGGERRGRGRGGSAPSKHEPGRPPRSSPPPPPSPAAVAAKTLFVP
ncbi:hypothetical protein JCM11491_005594 [Sporobolomyces phaffii]